jgi:hypothetical protein
VRFRGILLDHGIFKIDAPHILQRNRAGGPPFETVLIFRVAAPSWSLEGAEGLVFLSNEFVGHGRNEKSIPRPFGNERVGHPEKLNQSLGDDVLEWYHPCTWCRQEKKRERVGHPPIREEVTSAGIPTLLMSVQSRTTIMAFW